MKEYLSTQKASKWLIQYYLIGVAGYMIPFLRPFFLFLTPFGMVMAAVFLMYFHETKNLKTGLAFAGVAVLAFLVELIGVNTQVFFGEYSYGNVLGFKLWDTPLTIGLNWLVLVFCFASITKSIRDRWYFPLAGASAMVAFDWLIEPVAIASGMWSWAGGDIPVKNYIDWFLFSWFLFLMIRIFKIELNNPIARILFLMQFVFFLTLNILIRTQLWAS